MLFTLIFNPFISFFQIFSNLLKSKNLSQKHLLLIGISLALNLSILTSNRIVEGDLLNYQYIYNQLKNSGISQIFNQRTPEFIYYFILYFFSYFGPIGFKLKIFFSTFLIYFLPFLVWKKFLFENVNTSTHKILLIIIFFFLMPSLFNISTQVIRQLLAFSIIYFSLFNNKKITIKSLFLIFIGLFIHLSGLLVLLLFLLNKINFKNIFLYFGAILSVTFFINIYFSFLFDYLLLRLQETYSKSSILTSFNFYLYLYMIFIFTISIVLKFFTKKSKNDNLHLNNVIYLIVIILFFIFLGFNDYAFRFFYFIYFLQIPIFLIFIKFIKISKNLSLICIMSILILFTYNLLFSVWTYENIFLIFLPFNLLINFFI